MPCSALLSSLPTTASLALAFASLASAEVRAQSFLRGFGSVVFDSELGPASTWTEVAMGSGGQVVGRRTNGELVAWGNNLFGQCQVPTLSGPAIVDLAAGSRHNLALRADGS